MERRATRTAIIALIVGFAAYFLICMLLFEASFSFWIELGFALMAFATCIFVILRQEQAPSFFLKLPIYTVAAAYLITQLIVSTLFMIFPAFCNPWGYAISIFLFGGFLCIALTSQASTEHIASIDSQINEDTSFIKDLVMHLETLKETLPDNQNCVDELIEISRFSNLRSCKKAQPVEQIIQAHVNELLADTKAGNIEALDSRCDELKKLLQQRDQLCIRK